MSILLVSANREKIPYPVAPLGLLYIANRVKQRGRSVTILDLCFSNNIIEDIEQAVSQCKPNCVGVSIRNVDNLSFPGSVSYLADVKHIIDSIKNKTDAQIVLGGSAFSLFPEDILKFMGCTFGIIGEGEDAFIKLLDKIESEDTCYDGIENLIWIMNNAVYRNKISHANSFDTISVRGLIDNAKYAKFGGMGNIQTKRGCKFKCLYCTYPSLEGHEYRLRSPKAIVEEAKQLKEGYDTNHIFFVDNVFNYPLDHSVAVCEEIIKSRLEISWSCFASPKGMPYALLKIMQEAGCTHIEFGSDSLSELILSNLKKPFSISDIMQASIKCKKLGINNAHYIMFGGPGESIASLQEAFNNIRQLDATAILAMVGIRIYPGTGLQRLSIEENIITEHESLLDPIFYLSQNIPVKDLLQEISKFTAANSNCVVPGMEIRSSERIFSALRKHYQEGPLWSYLRK